MGESSNTWSVRFPASSTFLTLPRQCFRRAIVARQVEASAQGIALVS